MYTDIKTLRMQFEAEIQCINEHIESIKQLLSLDYSRFENKVINCKLAMYIDHSLEYLRDEAHVTLYSRIPYVLTEPDSNGVCGAIYAKSYRNVSIVFIIGEDRRFRVDVFKGALNTKLSLLESELLIYIRQISQLESDFKKIEDFKKEVTQFYKQFSGEMYSIARKEIIHI